MSETTNLKLFKHDNPSTNTNQFDVEKALNENWDKIDNAVGTLKNDIDKDSSDIAVLKSQIPTGQATGTEITLNDSSNLELINFDIAVNNSAHLVISNKNLLYFDKVSGAGITFEKNRVTIVNPTSYFYAKGTLVGGNKFLSGKKVIFTAVTNGTVLSGGVDFIIHTNKVQYRFQKKHNAKNYNDDKKSETWQFANDEYITSIFIYTTGATCNLTIDVQVSIVDAAFVEHEGAEFDITTDNLLAVVNQIKRNGTYKNVTHFYTTDETHPSINLEYYKDLETLFNNLIQANTQAESEG